MNQNPTKHTKVLIIGSGPAGYTAAVYAARAMLKPILVHGIQPGGQLTTTTDVENYPGFANVIQGPWLMDQMREQAEAVGTDMIEDHIASVDLKSKPFKAIGESGQEYSADSIIISTGAQARWLNLKSEQELRGFGVSACATCDGFFFKESFIEFCNAISLLARYESRNLICLIASLITPAASLAALSDEISMPAMMVCGSALRLIEILSICNIAPDTASILSTFKVKSCKGVVPPRFAPERVMVSPGSYPEPPELIEVTL